MMSIVFFIFITKINVQNHDYTPHLNNRQVLVLHAQLPSLRYNAQYLPSTLFPTKFRLCVWILFHCVLHFLIITPNVRLFSQKKRIALAIRLNLFCCVLQNTVAALTDANSWPCHWHYLLKILSFKSLTWDAITSLFFTSSLILSRACIMVVWSRPPKYSPMETSGTLWPKISQIR